MIGYLLIGIAIGLIAPVGVALIAASIREERDEIEADYEQLKDHSRQLCQEAESAKKEVARLRREHNVQAERADRLELAAEKLLDERDAESQRASANSARVQQLQDELNRAKILASDAANYRELIAQIREILE